VPEEDLGAWPSALCASADGHNSLLRHH
jgi:hypothetical protein